MIASMLRRALRFLRGRGGQDVDPVAREISETIDAIDRSLAEIRRELGIAESC